jgi:UPF0755 protein
MKKYFQDMNRIVLGVIIFFILILYWLTISSPTKYPVKTIINVRQGAGLQEVANTLKNDGIIRSVFWFRTTAILLGGERGLQAGDYYLPKKENVLKLAWRVVRGVREIKTEKVTIPEGFTKEEIANLFQDKFPKFNSEDFLSQSHEGYLFPDTYFIEISATSSSTIELMENNFKLKTDPLMKEIASSTHTFEDVISMASLLEEEAKTKSDREIISGILWKRLALGMPLQVDATLKYVTGKGTNELTNDDLKLDSPYNTYTNKGLPPTPISNPGLEAILAAIHPVTSPYLYFLTDSQGNMHFAKTFEEHKRNKEKYLK